MLVQENLANPLVVTEIAVAAPVQEGLAVLVIAVPQVVDEEAAALAVVANKQPLTLHNSSTPIQSM